MALAARASATSYGAAAWGENSAGQLGNGTTTSSTTPVAVKELAGVTAVSAGGEHGLALLSNGTVMAWGENREGSSGTRDHEQATCPSGVGPTGVTAISAGGRTQPRAAGKRRRDGMGQQPVGQLGVGSEQVKGEEEEVEEVEIEKSDVPVAVKGLTGVTAVAAGGEHSLALLTTGAVMAWGSDNAGQLGDGVSGGFANTATPVSGLTGVTPISAGARHSLALLASGTTMAGATTRSGS